MVSPFVFLPRTEAGIRRSTVDLPINHRCHPRATWLIINQPRGHEYVFILLVYKFFTAFSQTLAEALGSAAPVVSAFRKPEFHLFPKQYLLF